MHNCQCPNEKKRVIQSSNFQKNLDIHLLSEFFTKTFLNGFNQKVCIINFRCICFAQLVHSRKQHNNEMKNEKL